MDKGRLVRKKWGCRQRRRVFCSGLVTVGLLLWLLSGASFIYGSEETLAVSLNLNFKQGEIGKSLTGKNIYLPGEEVIIMVGVITEGNQERNISFEYQIIDFFGKTVGGGSKDLKVGSNSSNQTEIIYHPQKNGVFYVKYLIKDKGLIIKEGKTGFSVIPPESKSKTEPIKPSFGIVFGIPDMMGIAGLQWHRHDFTWEAIEPQEGKFNWDWSDRIVNDAVKYNYKMMPILDYSASWASTAPAGTPQNEKWGYPPKLKEWTNYVGAVVNRYKDKIKYWEVWNEPNGAEIFFRGAGPKEYVELLKATYLTAKKIDPDCKIVAPALAGCSPDYLEEVFRAGGIDYLDIVSYHPYRPGWGSPESTGFLEEVKMMKGLIDKYGGNNKPIWLTEYGWVANDLDPDSAKLVEDGVVPTERQQASYLARMYVQSLSTGYVKNFFWFCLRHPAKNFAEHLDSGVGLLRSDNTAKGALVAHRTIMDLFKDTKPVNAYESGSLRAYTFQRGNDNLVALWDVDGPQLVALDIKDKKIHLTDLMYNTEELPVRVNPLLLNVDDVPVFLQGQNIKVMGRFLGIESKKDTLSMDSPMDFKVTVFNPLERRLEGKLTATCPDLPIKPSEIPLSLGKREKREYKFNISVTNPELKGKKEVKFALNLSIPPSKEIVQMRELVVTKITALPFGIDYDGSTGGYDTKSYGYNGVKSPYLTGFVFGENPSAYVTYKFGRKAGDTVVYDVRIAVTPPNEPGKWGGMYIGGACTFYIKTSSDSIKWTEVYKITTDRPWGGHPIENITVPSEQKILYIKFEKQGAVTGILGPVIKWKKK